MPLELRKDSAYWYGRYKVNNQRVCVSLKIPVEGVRPANLRKRGDSNFEISRAKAQAKLNHFIEDVHSRRDAARLVEKLYELKTGETIKSVPLDDLPTRWFALPRRRPLNPRYAEQCKAILTRFVIFLRQKNPKAKDMAHITHTVAEEFMTAEDERGVTAKTWNDTLKLLRATCKYLLPHGSINPFFAIPTREEHTIFRQPFSVDELKLIVDAAKGDNFIRPIITTAICTAMRRGDCCTLQWKDVDMKRRFITVKTAKTGQTVSIPIFPMLYDELAGIEPVDNFVFPAQAKMYADNPDGITIRVRKVLAAAGFKDKDSEKNCDGKSLIGNIHAERAKGIRRASIRDFHSFRVTWVTLALTAGVPLELVQKVTGHKTADVVLKHYFQPGREQFRQAIQAAMPKLLTSGGKNPKEMALEILDGTTSKTWKKDAARLRELVSAL